MNAYVYVRVSTANQAESGLGAEMQEAACRSLCALRGWPVAGVFRDEGVSGTAEPHRRKGLQELVRAWRADAGERTVVVYDLKRLARSQRILWALLDERGDYRLTLASATEPFDTTTSIGRAMLGMLGVWAQLDWEQIRDRNRAMQAEAKRKGKRWGAPKMYEVRRKDPVTGKARYVVDPDLVERIRQVQERYRSGDYSLIELAKWLNDHGVASPLGKRWHLETVRRAVHTTLPHSCADDPARCSSEHPL